MTYPADLIPTTVVGSYPQPDWLVDRSALAQHGVPRVAAPDIWRIPEPFLEAAQNDATILAIGDMERAGIDIVSDGEIRRESYSNRFALALDGIDAVHPGRVGRSGGGSTLVPRVVGPIRRRGPVEVRDAEFLVAHATHATKITLPGPFTLSQQAENAFYGDEEEMAMDYAVAVNEELRRAEGDRGRCRAARRALGAHRPRQGGALGRQGDQPGAPRHRRADHRASVLRLCRDGEATSPPATRFCRSSPTHRRADLDRGGAAAARSRRARRNCPARRSCSGCSISMIPRSRPPTRSPRGCAQGLQHVPAERLVAGARLRHEIPAARARHRQIARPRPRRRDRPPRAGRLKSRSGSVLPSAGSGGLFLG